MPGFGLSLKSGTHFCSGCKGHSWSYLRLKCCPRHNPLSRFWEFWLYQTYQRRDQMELDRLNSLPNVDRTKCAIQTLYSPYSFSIENFDVIVLPYQNRIVQPAFCFVSWLVFGKANSERLPEFRFLQASQIR